MPWLDKLTALLHGYLTGQAGASALLDLITGKEVPSGKLAESYPYAYADCSMFNYADEKYRNLQYREGPFIGYRYYDTADIPVQFPFGYGLSYTTFAYDSLILTDEEFALPLPTQECVRAQKLLSYMWERKRQNLSDRKRTERLYKGMAGSRRVQRG